MADQNPFDQFDNPASSSTAANPFDQFDSHPSVVPVKTTSASTTSSPSDADGSSQNDDHDTSPTLMQRGYQDSAALLQNAVLRPIENVAQMGAHSLQSLTNAGASTAKPGSIGANIAGYVNDKVGALDNAIKAEEDNYQKQVPNRADTLVSAGVGNVLPYALGVGEATAPTNLSLLGKIGTGMATGGAIGAMTPVTTGAENPSSPSYSTQKAEQFGLGAVTGGVLPIAGEVASGIGNLVRHGTNPQAIAAQNIARLVGSDPATLAKLDSASAGNISGVVPTTAQAAPSATAVAAEKALGNTPAGKLSLVERQTHNNAARMAVLQQHAGDDVSMQAAKDARSAAVKPFVDQYLQPATPATRWTSAATPLDNVLSNPGRLSSGDFDALQQARAIVGKVKGGSMQEDDATAALKELEEGVTSQKAQNAFAGANQAINQNMIDPSKVLQAAALTRNTGLGARPAVRDALDRISATINQSKNTNGLVPADVLDSVRQNINDFLVSPTGKRATPQEALGVAPIRDQLVQTIGQHAPGYADYLAAYAKHSEPINTMQAAQSILDRVRTRALNSADAAPLSLNDINQGLKSIDKGRYGVSPQAQSDLQGIQDSLKREGISNSIRSPGSDTAYNLNAQGSLASNLLGPTLQGPTGKTRGIAALIGTVVGDHFGGLPGAGIGAGIGTFINKGADVINQRIMNAYTKGMLNPDEAAKLIRTYLKGNPGNASKLLGRYPQWKALLSSGSSQQMQKANP